MQLTQLALGINVTKENDGGTCRHVFRMSSFHIFLCFRTKEFSHFGHLPRSFFFPSSTFLSFFFCCLENVVGLIFAGVKLEQLFLLLQLHGQIFSIRVAFQFLSHSFALKHPTIDKKKIHPRPFLLLLIVDSTLFIEQQL